MSFKQRKDLDIQMRTHIKEKTFRDICMKSFSCKSTLRAHEATHFREDKYLCTDCPKTFDLKSQLDGHRKTHKGVKPFSCDICWKSFSWRNNLIIHKLNHTCTRKVKYSCSVCQKTFDCKSHMDRHMRSHTGEKPFSCDVCRKSFSLESNLNRHKLTHAREGKNSCRICKKTFYSKSQLDGHMETHTKPKPFPCDICQRSFSSKQNLETHTRITHSGKHTNSYTSYKSFSCDVCNLLFASKSSLDQHNFTHTGEPNQRTCSICKEMFTPHNHVDSLRRTNTGEKSSVCDTCHKSCSQKSSLVEPAVLAKYARHVCQTSADVQQSAPSLPDILSGSVKNMENVRQGRQELDIKLNFCQPSSEKKCPTEDQNVRHTIEGLSDISSSRTEISFARTEPVISHSRECQYSCFVCQKEFTDESSLVIHVITHTGEKPFYL